MMKLQEKIDERAMQFKDTLDAIWTDNSVNITYHEEPNRFGGNPHCWADIKIESYDGDTLLGRMENRIDYPLYAMTEEDFICRLMAALLAYIEKLAYAYHAKSQQA